MLALSCFNALSAVYKNSSKILVSMFFINYSVSIFTEEGQVRLFLFSSLLYNIIRIRYGSKTVLSWFLSFILF